MAATSAPKSLLLCLTAVAFLHHLQCQYPAAAATSLRKNWSSDGGNERTLNITLYQQETINKTAYIVVDGVAGAGVSLITAPFGTIYVFRDDLTVRADRASPVAGVAEGSSIITSLDGLQIVSLSKVTIDHRGYRGSVSVLRGTHSTNPSESPVVGGTGDFAYALGYIRSSPVDLQGRKMTYKVELHLYWPPYAHYAPVAHKPV